MTNEINLESMLTEMDALNLPRSEIVAALQEEVDKRFSKEFRNAKEWRRDLQKFMDSTGIKPSEDLVQRTYKSILLGGGERDYDNLTEMGLAPSTNTVNQVYSQLLKEVSSRIGTVCSMTFVKPEFKEDEIHEAYGRLLKRVGHYSEGIGGIWVLQKVTGIKPKPEEIQAAYVSFLNPSHWGWGSSVKELKGVTGVKPIFSKEDVHKQYLRADNWNALYQFEDLAGATDIKPDDELAQQIYLNYKIVNADFKAEGFAFLKRIMGILPSEETMHKVYAKLFDAKWTLETIVDLSRITGINPQVHEGKVQNQYVQNLISEKTLGIKEEEVKRLKKLQEITGVAPRKDVTDLAYRRTLERMCSESTRFESGYMTELSYLKEQCDRVPDLEVVQKTYAKLLEQDRLPLIDELTNLLGIVPTYNKTVIQKAYNHYAREAKLEQIGKLQKTSGIPPIFEEPAVQEGYYYLAKEKEFKENALKMAKITRMRPPADLTKKLVAGLL